MNKEHHSGQRRFWRLSLCSKEEEEEACHDVTRHCHYHARAEQEERNTGSVQLSLERGTVLLDQTEESGGSPHTKNAMVTGKCGQATYIGISLQGHLHCTCLATNDSFEMLRKVQTYGFTFMHSLHADSTLSTYPNDIPH